MRAYRKMLGLMVAVAAVATGVLARPVYYTIFHALDKDTMEVFTDGGNGSLMVSVDGGAEYETISQFQFDRFGRGVARVVKLSRLPGDALVKLEASFNESEKGQPKDTVVEASVSDFLDSLMTYRNIPWLAYAPVYVSYPETDNIVDIAIADGRFTVLVDAVVEAGLVDALSGPGPLTVFAPTDDAFIALLGELGVTAEELLANPDLGNILLYHVVGAALDGDAVAAEFHIETLLGKDVEVTVNDGRLFINESEVIIADIEASNGIIHVIDAVLLPPAKTIPEVAVDAGIFNTLVAALQETGLDAALTNEGPFTVFAPTDDAFAILLGELGISATDLLGSPDLADILLYHVVGAKLNGDAVAAESHLETLSGLGVDVNVVDDEIFINESKVTVANIRAVNGIIHVIDAVLIPPKSIPEVAEDAGIFNTLLAALQETGLDAALTNEGPFTVFAPTDDAFALLLDELGISAADLMASPDLADVLLYHVVDGRLKAEDVVALERITTKLGKDVKVNVTDEGVFINDSRIAVTDIKAENGIIHIIDAVLVPEEMPSIVEIAVGAGNFQTLVGALQATSLDDVLEGDGPFTVFAPTDEAFDKLPGWLLKFLVDNPKYLEFVLLYHVVAGDLSATEVIDQGIITTVNGRDVKAQVIGGHVYINRSKVIAPDIEASNGTIHVIDTVLIPWFFRF